ncbi:transcriptional regulator, AraC family [Caloramator quimbayensis]|uniref:Transcriptional regulator, AraC family n=1 Tax=Caloramator quimbayensis TaxID=1147123 RepID=A0A1T4WDM0_9CLOT|nr:helix-turn-helix domain-containing protein [Caloramator quimbayensis]SKA75383.1 transcriptional regulator, AraC family [Caloramator quimbayensis]
MKSLFCKIKKGIKLKSVFQRLIISYIVVISIILLIFTLVLYQGYKKQMMEQSEDTSKKILNQAEYYIGYTLNWAKSYMYQLYLDEDVYNLMFNNKSPSLIGETKIKQAALKLPFVQSIYIYNYNTNIIYTSIGNSAKYNSFYDKEIIDIIKKNNETMSTKFIPRKIAISISNQKYQKDVLSIMLTNIKSTNESVPYGAIILNVDADSVQAYFKDMSQKGYNLFAIDRNGRIIFGSNTDMFLNNISSQGYIQKILNSDIESGSFLNKINGKPYIITYKTSDNLGLKLINIVPYETLMGTISRMIQYMIKTFIILFILALILSFLCSEKIYSPIAEVIKTLKNYYDENNDFGDALKEIDSTDIEYMTKAVDAIIQKSEDARKLSDVDANFIKKNIIMDLLLNKKPGTDDVRKRLIELGVNLEFKYIYVILIKIDRYKQLIQQKYSQDKILAIENKVILTAENVCSKYYKCEILNFNDNEVCVIIDYKEDNEQKSIDKIIELIKKIQDILYDDNISVSASISKLSHGIENISKAYNTAQHYINYRFKYGLKSILYNEKINSDITAEYKYNENKEQVIFKCIKSGNIEETEKELDNMFKSFMELSYSDMIIAVTQLVINIIRVINNMMRMNRESVYINTGDFMNNMDSYETIDDIKSYIMGLTVYVSEKMKDKKSSKKNDVVDKVKNYIFLNYTDPSISLEEIAEKMKLSPSYLRVLFKEIEGKSLSTFINEVRFENAKKLLETTDLTVAEIAERVGFSNNNYFYTAFKKFYGVSPNQYRSGI